MHPEDHFDLLAPDNVRISGTRIGLARPPHASGNPSARHDGGR